MRYIVIPWSAAGLLLFTLVAQRAPVKSARRFKFKRDVVAWVLSVIMACTAMVLLPLVARGAVGSVVWVQPGVITGGTVPGISNNGSVHGCLTFTAADGTRNTRLAGYAADGTPTYSRDFLFPPNQGDSAPSCLLPSLQQTRPTLVGEQYYLADVDATGDNVYISAYSGATRIWRHAIESVHPTGAGTGTSIVDLQVGEDGHLYALEYVNNGEYYLEAIDTTTGDRIWRRTFTGSPFLPSISSRLWVTNTGIALTDTKLIEWISYDNQRLSQRTIPHAGSGQAHVDVAPDGTAYVAVSPGPVFDEPCRAFNGTVAALSPSSASDAPSWQFDFPPGPCQRLGEIRALPAGGAVAIVPGPGVHGIDALVKVDSSSVARHQVAWRQTDSSLASAVNEFEPSIDSGGHIMLTTRLPMPCQLFNGSQTTCIAADVRVYSPVDGTLVSDTPVPFQASDVSSVTTTGGDSTAYLSLTLSSGGSGGLFGSREAAIHIPDFGRPWSVSEIRAAYLARQAPPPGPPAVQKYVALGDSFSSGEGAPGPSGYEQGTDVKGINKCHRSDQSYSIRDAHLPDVPSSYIFRACSGAVIEDFFGPFPQNHPELNLQNPTEITPQLDWLDATTRLVTLTIGGNNAHFADVMLYCGGRAFYQPSCKARFGEQVDQAIANLAISASGRVNDNFPDLLSAIHRKVPGAKVLVLGYPRFFPIHRTAACYTGVPVPFRFFMGSDMQWINQEILKLNEVIKNAVVAQGFVYVDTFDAFKGHELCTLRPYFNSARADLQESYHPNVDGQKRLAAVLKKSLSQ